MIGLPPAVATRHSRANQESRGRTRLGPRSLRAIPVLVIVAVQAVLTGSLIHLSVASGQESQFIDAGHQVVRALWHGGGTPFYERYFPSAPAVYPVFAATADAVGGLAAARLMSLVFMLAATVMLAFTARRMFGYWPAVAGAGFFSVLAVTRAQGASATPDAMALALIAAAACCAVLAAQRTKHAARWLLAVPLTLLAANAVSYPTVLYDLAVIGLGALLVSDLGWRRAGQRALALSAATLTLLCIAAALAGTGYLAGIRATLLPGGAGSVLDASAWLLPWKTADLVLLLAAASLGVALIPGERRQLPRLLLCASAFLLCGAGAGLQHLHAGGRYDDVGAWWTCIAAGYAVGRLAELMRPGLAAELLGSLLVIPVAALAIADASPATALATAANSRIGAMTALQSYLALPGRQHFLIDSYPAYAYDLRPGIGWQQVTDSFLISYRPPGDDRYLHGAAGLAAAIRHHWFALISVNADPGSSNSFNRLVFTVVQATSSYELVSVSGGVYIYVYGPDYTGAR